MKYILALTTVLALFACGESTLPHTSELTSGDWIIQFYVEDSTKHVDIPVYMNVDSVGNFFGYSTDGAKAIAAIAPLASKVLMSVERFEGPQSNKDVDAYKEAAGKLSDPKVPPDQKQAAFNTLIEIMKRNAPTLDWDSVAGTAKTNAGTTSTGIKWERAK